MRGKRILYLDTETYSETDIKAGLYKYMEDPAFEILLLPFAWDDEPARVLDLTPLTIYRNTCSEELRRDTEAELQDIIAGLNDPDIIKVAHNSPFERLAYFTQFGKYQPPEEWVDTMILCAMNGLPMSLDAAGEALDIEQKKLKEGKALINYFCKPCKPTIANGGRTRNLPHHAPEKWAKFKEYAVVDVEAERHIYKRLHRFPVSDFERRLWALDARINERGVQVDPELVESAVAVDEAFTAEHSAEMKKLTGIDNPNSVAQLKEWLATVGLDTESLDKAAVEELKGKATDPTTRRVLELRQLLGKTSTTKYKAMTAAACQDKRVRGLLQFYGANRTGRWAGRLVQVQNLPKNENDPKSDAYVGPLEELREVVRARDLDTLELCVESVPDVLSQLIRTAFVAKEGHTFLVADYSAIEARVIAYLSGEQWRMDVFANGGDIYCSSASQMFKVPVEKHGINGHLRQKGKVAELACIAEGQKVLTDVGLVPIEDVTKEMKVWDGIQWVNHDGVVYKGEKEVLTYGGLEATADHIVWAKVNGQYRTIQLGDAAACGAHLIQAGDGRHPLWVGGGPQPGETMEQVVEPLLRPDSVQRVRGGTVAIVGQPAKSKIKRLSKLLAEASGSEMAGQKVHSGEAEMHQPEGRQLQELRREGYRVPLQERDGGLPLYDRDAWAALARDGAGQDRRQRSLRTGEPPVGDSPRELSEPTPHRRKVYDIVNAGPRHRFTVSNVLVHNCGYGGGVNALIAFGADKMGLTEPEMQEIVTQWRLASPTIPRLWRRVEDAAKAALENPGRRCAVMRKYRDAERAKKNELLTGGRGYSEDFLAGGKVCTFWRDKDALRCQLPSGRILTYWGARLEDGSITYMGQSQTKGRTVNNWCRLETWGGKLVENIVQGFARDCLAEALVRLDEAGYATVFHVHDEIVAEEPIDGRTYEEMAEVMGRPIAWAPGLLLRADGYTTPFYMKD